MTPMLAINWPISIMGVAFVLVCLFLILVILIQKPKGGGLSGAFGGSGGSAQAAFGAKTGDVLTWFTVFCFVAFLLLAMGLTWAIRPEHERIRQQVQQTSGTSALEEAVRQATTGAVPAPEATGEPDAAADAAETVSAPTSEPEPSQAP